MNLDQLTGVIGQKERTPLGYTLVATHLLKGTQTIVVCGDKAYYSPNIATGEVKILTLPEPNPEYPLINLYDSENIKDPWRTSMI